MFYSLSFAVRLLLAAAGLGLLLLVAQWLPGSGLACARSYYGLAALLNLVLIPRYFFALVPQVVPPTR